MQFETAPIRELTAKQRKTRRIILIILLTFVAAVAVCRHITKPVYHNFTKHADSYETISSELKNASNMMFPNLALLQLEPSTVSYDLRVDRRERYAKPVGYVIEGKATEDAAAIRYYISCEPLEPDYIRADKTYKGVNIAVSEYADSDGRCMTIRFNRSGVYAILETYYDKRLQLDETELAEVEQRLFDELYAAACSMIDSAEG